MTLLSTTNDGRGGRLNRVFDIWYFKLKCLSVLNISVVHWLANPTSVSAGSNYFTGQENINLLFVSCSGTSIKKQWRERQGAQLYYFHADGRVVVG